MSENSLSSHQLQAIRDLETNGLYRTSRGWEIAKTNDDAVAGRTIRQVDPMIKKALEGKGLIADMGDAYRLTDAGRGYLEGKPKLVITMYVRRGDDIVMGDLTLKTRTISLSPIPDKVSARDWLCLGFAYDGDSLSVSISPYTEIAKGAAHAESKELQARAEFLPFAIEGTSEVLQSNPRAARRSLFDVLHQVQAVVFNLLSSLGYEVKIA